MSSSSNHVCCHRNRHLLVSLLFLLVSSLTHVRFMAEGRSLSRLLEAAQVQGHQGVKEGAVLVHTVRQFKFPSQLNPKTTAEPANSQLQFSQFHTQEVTISQTTSP
ncbi:hypothetical protein COLO4_35369 [Corchorus olitorius]|uniref:Uncharacterized protein n=1 Tax=Corchorus olitorius TaxID=93759 RepID=A0A1R3GHA8_9ROSI|nr:hypothetical protein COLO4_35369 [Corchorus olitorius]